MKRGREDQNEDPNPKKAMAAKFFNTPLLVFQIVFPYLYPGHYDKQWDLALKTYLSLLLTCKALFFDQILRRWVGWLSDVKMRPWCLKMTIPAPMTLVEGTDYHIILGRMAEKMPYFKFCPHPVVASQRLVNHFRGTPISNFELTVGNIPFYNIFEITGKTAIETRRVICYVAPTFAEMVLFCYAAMISENQEITAFLVLPRWHVKEETFIFFEDQKKKMFMNKYLLGRLRVIGFEAPRDYGFDTKMISSYAHWQFFLICDTSGKRLGNDKGTKEKIMPFDRLENFIRLWYPMNVFNRTKLQQTSPLYFPIKSEK